MGWRLRWCGSLSYRGAGNSKRAQVREIATSKGKDRGILVLRGVNGMEMGREEKRKRDASREQRKKKRARQTEREEQRERARHSLI